MGYNEGLTKEFSHAYEWLNLNVLDDFLLPSRPWIDELGCSYIKGVDNLGLFGLILYNQTIGPGILVCLSPHILELDPFPWYYQLFTRYFDCFGRFSICAWCTGIGRLVLLDRTGVREG